MDAHKPDSAAQAGERPGTRPPEDIFSALPPEAPAPDGPDGKRSWPARIWQVLRLIFIGDAEHEQRPATGMAERLRENFSQASSAGARPMTRKELFAALPLIGSAGVSAVPMAARVSQKVGQSENPSNFLLMHAMGPNVAGVIGSAVAAGILINIFG